MMPRTRARRRRPGFLRRAITPDLHGARVIMIFFMAMAFMIVLNDIVVPLQIGARDGSRSRSSRR